MTNRTKRGLKFAAAAIFALLLVTITINGAVDYWMPQADLKEPSLLTPAPEPVALQIPEPVRPLPPALPEQPAAASVPPWNQPMFEPKFDAPGYTRRDGSQALTAPDFHDALKAPLSQVLPPAVSVPNSDPAVVSIRPIFNSKAGGVESGVIGGASGLAGSAGSTVGGAASGAGSLLKR